MLSKEEFCKVMRKIEGINKKIENVDKALKELSPDFCGFYIEGLTELFVEILEKDLGDGEDWLGYFIFENDFLREYKDGDIQLRMGENWVDIDLEDWGDVYDFIRRHGSVK